MFHLSIQPQSVWGVIGDSFKLYFNTFKRVFLIAFLFALLAEVPQMIVHYHYGEPLFRGSFFVILGIDIIVFWLVVCLLYYMYQLMTNSNHGIKDSIRTTLIKFPLYFIASIIMAIIVVIASLLLLIPGIFLHYLLGFFIFCILFENKGIISSFKRSAQLVWGNWWRTFFVLVFPMIFAIILFVLFDVVFDYPVFLLYRFHPLTLGHSIHAVSIIVATVMFPWLLAINLCMYHDLKLRWQTKHFLR